ncbi:HpcH/HpaI aldolase/citrate lyase family protein [Terrabacter terrigena]|uniref:HpcH/HpaI aldolase/citrate lyase family protein n=1 Tax=Terrabacter terrigena TaxID=574718 RepID=A0ABW3N4B6_9MICO
MRPAAYARSLLFVPGDRPDRFDKAAASGTDLVVLDLEDAVTPSNKSAALANALAWLHRTGADAAVRINGHDTTWHSAEIDALASTTATVMLPKAENPAAIAQMDDRLGGDRIIALIETAVGIRDVHAVCSAPGVTRAALGTVDLAAELGVSPSSHAAFAYARSALVVAAAAAGLPPPIDGVTTMLKDPLSLQQDLANASELGFGAKLCVHPEQVSAVNKHFTPSTRDLEWALRVASAARGADAVAVVDGAMIDAPVVRRAASIVHRSQMFDGTLD